MADVIRFGGFDANIAPSDSKQPEPKGQSSAEAWGDQSKYARLDLALPQAKALDLDKLSPEDLRFELKQWLATVWSERNEVPPDDQLADFDLASLEKEFRTAYVAGAWLQMQRGASAEGIWIAEQLVNKQPYVWAINREQPQQPLDRISRKRFFDAVDLIWLLGAVCIESRLDQDALPVATFDSKTGHVIYLAGLNPFDYHHPSGISVRRGWFSFHDPWPARSLLAAGRNSAAVSAIEDYPRAPFWLISPDELARVVYGTWLPLAIWQKSFEKLADSADALERDRRTGSLEFPSPPWADGKGPFSVLIDLAGGVVGTETICSLGAGRLRVEAGEFQVAEKWFELAFHSGGPSTGTDIAAVYEDHGEHSRAKQWLQRAALGGDSVAAKVLGLRLLREDEKDPSGDAQRWLKQAADSGDPEAAESLGTLLIGRDQRLAAKQWFRRAAEANNVTAAAKLGMLLAEENDHEARVWLERAVYGGAVQAALVLAGDYYDEGDRLRARKILEWAFDRGDPDAAVLLSTLEF